MPKVIKPKSVKSVTIFCPVCEQKVARREFVAHAAQHMEAQRAST